LQDIKSAVHFGLASHHVPVVPRCTLELTWQLQCTRLCMQLGQSEALSMFGVGTMDAGDGLLAVGDRNHNHSRPQSGFFRDHIKCN
jgi:hypothetical protein